MGYQGRTFRLWFADSPGLEVVARSLSVRKALALGRKAAELGDDPTDEQVKELFIEFAKRVKSWTLSDDDDVPLPVCAESLMEFDYGDSMKIWTAWLQQCCSVSGPLTAGSAGASGTSRSLEDSIPMEDPGDSAESPTDSAAGT